MTTSAGKPVRIVYFAWVRERVGHAEDVLVLPDDVATVADLIRWLSARGETYAYAFARPDIIRAAIDQLHVRSDTKIGSAREIAFFPPVTGG